MAESKDVEIELTDTKKKEEEARSKRKMAKTNTERATDYKACLFGSSGKDWGMRF
jgi:hypothetical protein